MKLFAPSRLIAFAAIDGATVAETALATFVTVPVVFATTLDVVPAGALVRAVMRAEIAAASTGPFRTTNRTGELVVVNACARVGAFL